MEICAQAATVFFLLEPFPFTPYPLVLFYESFSWIINYLLQRSPKMDDQSAAKSEKKNRKTFVDFFIIINTGKSTCIIIIL